jgi:predicted transcriptional regulator
MTKKMTITLEDELIEELSQTALQLCKKKEENREAIQERNQHVEKYGIFGEEYRSF